MFHSIITTLKKFSLAFVLLLFNDFVCFLPYNKYWVGYMLLHGACILGILQFIS